MLIIVSTENATLTVIKKISIGATAAVTAICLILALTGALDRTTLDALKVQHILKTIKRHQQKHEDKELTAAITEKELNAYIAYRLTQENSPLINSLTVRLLENNRVNGRFELNTIHLKLDRVFGDKLNLDFMGNLITRNGVARLDMAELRLNGQRIEPQILDIFLAAASRYRGTELGGVDDWYALPKGIDRILVNKGKAILYY